MKAERVWQASALVLAVWAAAASLDTLLSAPRHREVLARKADDLRRIRASEGRWAQEDALRARLEAGQAWKPADLDELAVRTLGADRARIELRSATEAAGDWQRREAAVELRDTPYDEAAVFLAAAAEHQPPWRLRQIEIRPAAEAGRGALSLTLEALEKQRP